MTPDERLVVAAVKAIVADVRRGVADSIITARALERLSLLFEPAERPSERRERENAAALAEMAAIGNGRDAAMRVAKRWARDPLMQETLSQRFRRLKRRLAK